MLNVELYIGNDRLDLFDDEKISMNIVTKNLQQIDKVFNDFSQSFTIPASQQNNKVLEHWYSADIANLTFNPAVKQAGQNRAEWIAVQKWLFSDGKSSRSKTLGRIRTR